MHVITCTIDCGVCMDVCKYIQESTHVCMYDCRCWCLCVCLCEYYDTDCSTAVYIQYTCTLYIHVVGVISST